MERLDSFYPTVGLALTLSCSDPDIIEDRPLDFADSATGQGQIDEPLHPDEPLVDTGLTDSGASVQKYAWACADRLEDEGVFDSSPSFFFSDTGAQWLGVPDYSGQFITHDVARSWAWLQPENLKALAHLRTDDFQEVDCYGSIDQVAGGELTIEVDLQACMAGDFRWHDGNLNVKHMELQLVDASCHAYYAETQLWYEPRFTGEIFAPEP